MRDSLPVNAGRRYFAAADVLRILCIFTVAWFHIWQQSWLDPSFRIAGHYFDHQRIVRRGVSLFFRPRAGASGPCFRKPRRPVFERHIL